MSTTTSVSTRHAVLRQGPLLLIIAATCAVLYSACSDSPAGAPAAQHRWSEAALASDMVVEASFDGGYSSYRATLPPATVTGTISQTLEATWDPAVHRTVDPVVPQGWTSSYYAGATLLPAAPTTPAGWATVSRIVSTGAAQVEGVDSADRQALSSTISAPPVVIAASFSGGATGDGWDVFFDPQYTRVFNIHHHNGPQSVMCRQLVDSGVCLNDAGTPGWPIPLTQTNYRSTGVVDELSNKLWQPTVTTPGAQLAWDCVDLNRTARCVLPDAGAVVLSQFRSQSTDYNGHIDFTVIGRKMYTVGFTPTAARITCLDMGTGAECLGVQLVEFGNFNYSGIDSIGTNLYVLTQLNGKLDCFDSLTMNRCAGAWPVQTNNGAQGRVHAVPSADGVLRNICADHMCYSLDGSATTLPAGYRTYANLHRSGALAANNPIFSNYDRKGTRVTWAADNSQLQCWDLATDAKCSTFFPFTFTYPMYASKFDPVDDDCIWLNADNGVIRNYKISTGALGCGGGIPKITFRGTISVPRLGCDPASRVFEYKSFKLLAPTSSSFTSATLSIQNSTGAPLAGWQDVPLPANGLVDLSTLTTALAGFTPTFVIAVPGFTDRSIIPSAEFRVTTGSTPQMCLTLSVPDQSCPTTAGLAGNAVGSSQVTTVQVLGSASLDGGAAIPYTTATFTPSVRTDPPNASNCGSRLTATVVRSGNVPVPYVTVYLLDGTGAAVLDANSMPVSAVSSQAGTVDFIVWGATYRLKALGTPAFTPSTMTVTGGGVGTTAWDGTQVTSNQVTVSRVGPGSVTLLGTSFLPAVPTITAPAAGALLGGTPTISGACITGDTVRVFEGATQLCSFVCAASAYSCVSSALADGSHSIFATQTDSIGQSPNSATRTFTTDATAPIPPGFTTPAEGSAFNVLTATFSGSCEAAATVRVLEGATVLCTATCASAGTFTCPQNTLTEGVHAVVGRQTDLAGNVSADSAPRTFTLDVTAPTAPALAVPVAVTNTPTPTLSGTCEAGATVTVMENAATVCTATCSVGSTFTCVAAPLTEGDHTLYPLQRDPAGNLSPPGTPRVITIDLTAPSAPSLLTPAEGQVTGASTPSLTGSCEAGATVTVRENASTLCSALCSGAGAFSCTSTALGSGPHAVTASQLDRAGNLSADSATRTFVVDLDAPAAPVLALPAAGSLTNDSTPPVSGSCETGATVTVYEGATVRCSATCVASAFTCDSSVLADGARTLTAQQSDAYGNLSALSQPRAFTVDATAPSAPVFTEPPAFTGSTSPSIVGTCETGAQVSVTEGATVLCTASCTSGAFSCISAALTQGAHTLTATQTDAATNVSAGATRSVTVDSSIPAPAAIESPTEGSATQDTTPAIAGRCAPFATVSLLEGARLLCTTTCLSTGLFVCDAALLTEGAHAIVANQVSQTGTTSPASALRHFVVDTTGPSLASLTLPAEGALVNSATPSFTGTCETFALVRVVDQDVSQVLCQATCNAGTFACSSATVLADGAHHVAAVQIDSAGNPSAVGPVRSFGIDTGIPAAPLFTTPVAGALANTASVLVSGVCEGAATVRVFEGATLLCQAVCTSAGTFGCNTPDLADGPHLVTAAQEDLAGNVSPNAAPRSVTIDTHPPVIPAFTTPAADGLTNQVTLVVEGVCETGANVTVSENATVLCQAPCAASTFTCTTSVLGDGLHSLVLRQVDLAGNLSGYSTPRNITVDATPPAAPTIAAPLEGRFLSDTQPTVSGVCETGSQVVVAEGMTTLCTSTCVASAYACQASLLGQGLHHLVVKQTDAAGNVSPEAPRAFTVDTVAPSAPVVSTPSPGQVLSEPLSTFGGTAEPGSTVVVSSGGSPLCTAIADAQGAWTCSASVPAGSNSVTATAMDTATNVSAPSAVQTFTQVFSIPRPTISSPVANSTIGGPDVTVTGTATAQSVVVISDETGATLCTATTDAAGVYTCSGVMVAGEHTLLASETWRVFKADSELTPVTVLVEAALGGGGCGCSTGSVSPGLLLALGALWLSRRPRRAKKLAA